MGHLGVRHSPQSVRRLVSPVGIIRWLYRAFGWTTGLRVRALPDYATSLLRRGLILSHDRLSGRPVVLPAMDAYPFPRKNELECRMPSLHLRSLLVFPFLLAVVRMGTGVGGVFP